MLKPHTWHNILPFAKELPVNMSGTTMISYCTTRRDFNSSITGKKYKISNKRDINNVRDRDESIDEDLIEYKKK